MDIHAFIGVFIKIFFLLTPFFILSVFVILTRDRDSKSKKLLAIRTSSAVMVICVVLYLFGDTIFRYLGITLDAFRIGSGLVLLLSGIDVVRGSGIPAGRGSDDDGDIAVVPLAIPYTVGPGTIGAMLVMGAGATSAQARISELTGIVLATAALGTILFYAEFLERILKRKGLNILSKLTGLFLVALASQIILEGILNIIKERL